MVERKRDGGVLQVICAMAVPQVGEVVHTFQYHTGPMVLPKSIITASA